MNWNAALQLLSVVGVSFTCVACDRAEVRTTEVYPVDGQLYYQNKPAVGATVKFHAAGASQPQPPVACQVRDDGHFVPVQPDGAVGLPTGQYTLTADWVLDASDRFAGRYADVAQPLSTIQVESTVNLLPVIRVK